MYNVYIHIFTYTGGPHIHYTVYYTTIFTHTGVPAHTIGGSFGKSRAHENLSRNRMISLERKSFAEITNAIRSYYSRYIFIVRAAEVIGLVDWEATSVPYLQRDFRHIWNHEYWCRGMSGAIAEISDPSVCRGATCTDRLQRRNMGGRPQKHFMLRGMTYSSAESYSPASRPISGKSQMTPRNAIWEVNLGIFILAAGSWCLLICYVGGRVTSPSVAISGLTHHFLSLSEPFTRPWSTTSIDLHIRKH